MARSVRAPTSAPGSLPSARQRQVHQCRKLGSRRAAGGEFDRRRTETAGRTVTAFGQRASSRRPATCADQPTGAPLEQTKTETPQASEAKAPEPANARADAAAALLADIKKRLGEEGQSLTGPELDIQATDEGILISLTDRQNYSMFAIGSAEPQPRVVHMMDAIAMSLETMPGAIVVRGHTDAHPYHSTTYDNLLVCHRRARKWPITC